MFFLFFFDIWRRQVSEFPRYNEYVVYPLDVTQLEQRVQDGRYATTRAFLADFRWILHNCIIFNSFHSKLTNTARTMMKVRSSPAFLYDSNRNVFHDDPPRCASTKWPRSTRAPTATSTPTPSATRGSSSPAGGPTCSSGPSSRSVPLYSFDRWKQFFLNPTATQGFPHWPAKAMKANKDGNVDVRFFGAHDRAWVPAKDCFLYSHEMPLQVPYPVFFFFFLVPFGA